MRTDILKTFLAIILTPVITLGIYACHNKASDADSKVVAEQKNDEKFDSRAGEKDAQFVVDAIANSLAEVRLTEAAEQRAIDPEVRKVAINLNREHNALIKRLQSYADKKAISYPAVASEKDKNRIEKLVDVRKNFDKAWCEQAHDINKETIASFEAASTSLSDANLKAWVANALPEIRKSHDGIMACQKRLR